MRETNPVFVPVRRDRMTSRIRRALIRAVVALTGSYVLLLRFPEPVFAHSEFHRGITFYSRSPLPSGLDAIAEDVVARLSVSPLYRVETRHRIFITESPALYALFNGPYRRAMARNVEIGHAIFVPRLDVASGRLVHFDGRSTPAAAVLAHEIMHTFVTERVGLIASWRLPWWKREGYPEYIGSRGGIELDSPPAYRNAARRWKELLDRGVPFDTVIARRNP
jgi:hypothetical protein